MQSVKVGEQSIEVSKIVCVGRNYHAHIEELGNEVPDTMVLFVKPSSAISTTLHAQIDEPLHYEGEICFLVKDNDLYAIGFGLDLTKRDLQSKLKSKGLPWERAKAFDGAACFSAFVPLNSIDLSTLSLKLKINQKIIQHAGYDLMIHKPRDILREVTSFMTLNDGDIIMTGTPQGVGKVMLGDEFVGQVYANEQCLVDQNWIAS